MGVLKSKKQEGFAKDYVLLGDASKAYRNNYNCKRSTAKSINQAASKLLKNANVAPRVAELQAIITKKAEQDFNIDADWLLNRLIETEEMDVLDILNDDISVKPVSL